MEHRMQKVHRRVPGLLGDVVNGATHLVGDTVSLVTQAAGDLLSPKETSSLVSTPTTASFSVPSQTITGITTSTFTTKNSPSNGNSNTIGGSSSSVSSNGPNQPATGAGGATSVGGSSPVSPANGPSLTTIPNISTSPTPGLTSGAVPGTTNQISGESSVVSSSLSSNSASAVALLNVADASSADISASSPQISGPGIAAGTNYTHKSTSTATSSSSPGSNGSVNSQQATSQGLPAGAIAAIIIVAAITVIAVFILVIRKWYQRRRNRRLENWATGMGGSLGLFNAISDIQIEKQSEKDDGGASGNSGRNGTRSARSSFGTTYDHGLRPFTPDPFSPDLVTISTTPMGNASVIPPLTEPSVSNFTEFYHNNVGTPTSFLSPAAIQRPETAANPSRRSDRSSVFSVGTASTERSSHAHTDEVNSQYLLVPPPDGGMQNQLSPISVRPWSPSERWAFPKPPTVTSSVRASVQTSAVNKSVNSDHFPASSLPPLSHPDPFADPKNLPASKSGDRSEPGQYDGVKGARRLSSATIISDGAATSTSDAVDTPIGNVEIIKRPFVPTLADELLVKRGDSIRVLQLFDDGWVHVAKVNTNGGYPELGLIPVDCLREAGEPLPSFLASRNVNVY